MWPFSDKKKITPDDARAMQGETQEQEPKKKRPGSAFKAGGLTIRGKKGYEDVMDVGQ